MAESKHKFASQYDMVRRVPMKLRHKVRGLTIQVGPGKTEDDPLQVILAGQANNLNTKLEVEAAVRAMCTAEQQFVSQLRHS
ncbi:hypothetical protein CL628_02345 [bacterium]|nr:hypothetical protein [bacterium]|tara:strand:- start:453 stop:698 length:246 start_codon:yes stop_codon:yes gene_type:complete